MKNIPAKEAPAVRAASRFPLHPNPMMLWKTNQRCNFSCEYCFCSVEELSKEHPLCGRFPPEHIARRFDETGRSWTVFMTGGEPFLYPDFLGLCRELSKNHFLAMNTNLSTSNVARFADEVDPSRVRRINASFHILTLERTNKLGDFLRNLLRLQDGGYPVNVEYVAYPAMFSRIEQDLRILETSGARTVNLKVYRGAYAGKLYPRDYTPEEKALFLRKGQDPTEMEFIDDPFAFRGGTCRTGVDFLFMGIDGRIRRCPGSAKSYGDFLAGHYVMDKAPRACPFPRCTSPWVGREYAERSMAGAVETLRETIREGVPFVFNKRRVRMAIESFRDRRRLKHRKPESGIP